tara:strand:+ start:1220 stop:1393 length:174 start_codon:yes stop_codon:yes gene_type:complete
MLNTDAIDDKLIIAANEAYECRHLSEGSGQKYSAQKGLPETEQRLPYLAEYRGDPWE